MNAVHRKEGISLLETLVVVSAFALFACSVMTLYVSVTRASAAATRQIEVSRTTEDLRADFSRIIRESAGPADAIGKYANDEHQLVLRMPPLPSEPGKRYAVMNCTGKYGRATLLEVLDSGAKQEVLRYVEYRVPTAGIHFLREGRLVTTTLDVKMPARKGMPPTLPYRFRAAMRGQGESS